MPELEQDVLEARARVNGVRIAPRKVRVVIDLVRGKSVSDAISILRYTPKRAAKVVKKLIESAAANAEHNQGMRRDELYVHAIWADGGPTLKRINPRSRGQAFPILKRSSHVTVVLRERN